jgi:hypothetical protein
LQKAKLSKRAAGPTKATLLWGWRSENVICCLLGVSSIVYLLQATEGGRGRNGVRAKSIERSREIAGVEGFGV